MLKGIIWKNNCGGFDNNGALFFMILSEEGCMRITKQQLGNWEQSQHLFEDRRKARSAILT
jgi:hypothetical protein